MPDDITPSAGSTQAVTPAPSSTQAVTNTTPDTQAVDGTEQLSLEEARKLRKENQALRTRQKTLDDAEEAKRIAALSEVEKANKQVQDLQQKYEAEHKQHINALVKLAAHALHITAPDLAAMYAEGKLEFGDNGEPTNMDKVLGEFAKNYPDLVKNAESAQSPAQTATPRPPQFTPNNPGRSGIQMPGQAPQGQPFTPTRLTDVFKRP